MSTQELIPGRGAPSLCSEFSSPHGGQRRSELPVQIWWHRVFEHKRIRSQMLNNFIIRWSHLMITFMAHTTLQSAWESKALK